MLKQKIRSHITLENNNGTTLIELCRYCMFNLKNFSELMKILTSPHSYLLNNRSIYLKPNN